MLPAQLANVVNASVTMFFHSVQRLGRAHGRRAPGRRTRALCSRARPTVSIPPLTLFIWPANALAITRSRPNSGLFRLQARALTAQLSAPAFIFGVKGESRPHARGSALAVGARRVASAAWRIEELASASGDQGSAEARAIAALQSAVTEALTEIDRIRG